MSLLRSESDLEDMTDMHDSGRDREISLGTSTLLGIFFALALVCSAFFGFGYSLGRKSAQPTGAPVVAATTDAPASGGLFKSFKPSPGSPVKASATSSSDGDEASKAVTAPATRTEVVAVEKKAFDPDASVVGDEPAPAPKTAPIVRQAPAVVAPVAGGTAVVQVAAVSHQEDADVLLSALRRKGYSVSVRQEPQDKLLHVQLGPYASKKDAEAMRQKLLGDGYNAIVK
ncbi:SPOR domain-containing protein [Granulicella sibirica]|uniref:DedD protein n=1 Tax=Granulicella sibirica TaxID=2479048 RepID=A0A4Q0T2R9_9BACT|nr:SPOR domain-containing protein [Granulicella sibirica]RXH57517.1 DedD protein [Granulicella sibirica]